MRLNVPDLTRFPLPKLMNNAFGGRRAGKSALDLASSDCNLQTHQVSLHPGDKLCFWYWADWRPIRPIVSRNPRKISHPLSSDTIGAKNPLCLLYQE
jgi:hypothetical protein